MAQIDLIQGTLKRVAALGSLRGLNQARVLQALKSFGCEAASLLKLFLHSFVTALIFPAEFVW